MGRPEDYGPTINAVIWSQVGASLFFLCLRLYCKFKKRSGLWWDDHVLIASWVRSVFPSYIGALLLKTNIVPGYLDDRISINNMECVPRLRQTCVPNQSSQLPSDRLERKCHQYDIDHIGSVEQDIIRNDITSNRREGLDKKLDMGCDYIDERAYGSQRDGCLGAVYPDRKVLATPNTGKVLESEGSSLLRGICCRYGLTAVAQTNSFANTCQDILL